MGVFFLKKLLESRGAEEFDIKALRAYSQPLQQCPVALKESILTGQVRTAQLELPVPREQILCQQIPE